MHQHEKINYVELPAADLAAVKSFFSSVFGWTFTDYGHEYTAFSDAGIDGGFFKADHHSSSEHGCVLVVLYSSDLEATQEKIKNAGGQIIQPTFSFPGGRRFHFADPTGNEYGVWSDVG